MLHFFVLFHSAGIFKCPEDQMPLDYAKVGASFPVNI